jgi:hypothetical protein
MMMKQKALAILLLDTRKERVRFAGLSQAFANSENKSLSKRPGANLAFLFFKLCI